MGTLDFHTSSTIATAVGYGIRPGTNMWVFRVNNKTGVLDLEILALILHDLKTKGIPEVINNYCYTFDYEEILLADISNNF